MPNKAGLEQDIQDKIIRVIKALIPHAKIYLYGSRARGTFKERSDIDIALDAGQQLPRIQVGEVSDMLNASNISYKMDVVDLHAISPEMKENILREGVVWKD